jgi:hypothetical protein
MGAIYKPEDAKRRRIRDKALEDLDPSVREAAKRLIEGYKGEELERKLSELIGYKKLKDLTEKKM